jgi:hypothetical protein
MTAVNGARECVINFDEIPTDKQIVVVHVSILVGCLESGSGI